MAVEADLEILPVVNKIDLPAADMNMAREAIEESIGIDAEDAIGVSAKTGEGIENLLEAISLQAEVLELKANVKAPGKGVVVEAKLTRGRGPVATVLVQEGTLSPGDMFITGHQSGKIRALMNDRGTLVKEAGPSVPVEVLGLDSVPQAGDTFYVVRDASKLRHVVDEL
ncbi:MAG: translation initiation factor IF-2, partial [Verrucomicrobiae bacterium]|nr:translation initiation factor IF-2 [Verrucomicrobiae bacterium]